MNREAFGCDNSARRHRWERRVKTTEARNCAGVDALFDLYAELMWLRKEIERLEGSTLAGSTNDPAFRRKDPTDGPVKNEAKPS